MKAIDIISGSLRVLGVIEPGEVIDGNEAADGLVCLNGMIDTWNAERLSVFTINRDIYTLPANTQTRLFGAGGDWNAARPSQIERMSAIPNYAVDSSGVESGIEYPMEYTTEEGRWQRVSIKSNSSSWPSLCYDTGDFPKRKLYFWPVPNVTAVSIAVYSWAALGNFANLTTDYTFPPGYIEAIKYNLAIRLAPEYGKTDLVVVASMAEASKALIASANLPTVEMQADPALTTDSKYGKGIVNTAAMNAGFF